MRAAESQLRGVDATRPPPLEVLIHDVALLEIGALAPHTAAPFPWACVSILIGLGLWWRRRARM